MAPLSRRAAGRAKPSIGRHILSWKKQYTPRKPKQSLVTPGIWEKRDAWSLQRFEQLNGIVKESASDGLKFLATVNLGGLAAVLALMGSMKVTHPYLTWGGAAFMSGLFEVGVCYFFRYLYMAWLLDGWNGDYREVLRGIRSWDSAIQRDIERGDRFDWGSVVAVLSLSFFVVGSTLAFAGAYEISRLSQQQKPPITSR